MTDDLSNTVPELFLIFLVDHEMSSPESMGMVAGLIYLVTMFLFIPFPFMKWFTASNDGNLQELKLLTFPNLKVRQYFCSYFTSFGITMLSCNVGTDRIYHYYPCTDDSSRNYCRRYFQFSRWYSWDSRTMCLIFAGDSRCLYLQSRQSHS